MQTAKYVRKPLFVDAIKVTSENFEDLAKWCQGEINNTDGSMVESRDAAQGNYSVPVIKPAEQYVRVRVHNPKNVRQTKAFVGDWILYTERGYKVYTEKAFTNSFDPMYPDPPKVEDAGDLEEIEPGVFAGKKHEETGPVLGINRHASDVD